MSVIAQIISELRQTANGAAVLDDWLGAGGEPVSQCMADARAFICKDCPLNLAPNWWARFFKNPIARAIQRHLEVKNQIGLKVAVEDSLAMCKACGCATRLKVWVPIQHIKHHHKPEYQYDPRCWIKTEMET